MTRSGGKSPKSLRASEALEHSPLLRVSEFTEAAHWSYALLMFPSLSTYSVSIYRVFLGTQSG